MLQSTGPVTRIYATNCDVTMKANTLFCGVIAIRKLFLNLAADFNGFGKGPFCYKNRNAHRSYRNGNKHNYMYH